MNADERIKKLKQNYEQKKQGIVNIVPFYNHFPRLSEYLPGMFKGSINTLMAPTGVGKTKAAKYFTVLMPHMIKKQLPKFDYHTIYFALEESKEEFIDNLFIYLLKMRYNISIDYATLNSYTNKAPSAEVFKRMEECREEVNEILSNTTIYDSIHNPTGLYNACKDYADANGEHVYKKVNFSKHRIYDKYIPSNNKFVIVVVDHISLLESEYSSKQKKTLSKAESMALWSSEYCLKKITKHWNWIVWNVQQTTMTGDDTFNKKNNTLEPTMADAANNKEILRDSKVILALYDPNKHEINRHNGYVINAGGNGLKNNYRSLEVLKNRYGQSNITLGLYMDGATGIFKELPPVGSGKLKQLYKRMN